MVALPTAILSVIFMCLHGGSRSGRRRAVRHESPALGALGLWPVVRDDFLEATKRKLGERPSFDLSTHPSETKTTCTTTSASATKALTSEATCSSSSH